MLIITKIAILIGIVCTGIVFGQEKSGKENRLASVFDYDSSAPLDVQIKSTAARGNTKVIDLSYKSPKGGRVTAYLIVPDRKGKFPGLIFHHWMMQDSPTANRTEFVDEAVTLAENFGAASLLIDAPMKRTDFSPPKDDPLGTEDVAVISQDIIDVRRGIDLLVSHSNVDVNRLAYVGHSFGATMGGILTAAEPRFKTFVLMAGLFKIQERDQTSTEPGVIKWRQSFPKGAFEKYLELTRPLDPANYISRTRTAGILLQYAKDDDVFSGKESIKKATDVAGEPKTLKIYETGGHALNEEARKDRINWLRDKLDLSAKTSSANLSEIQRSSLGSYQFLTFTKGIAAGKSDRLPLIVGLHYYTAKPEDIIADFDEIDFPARIVLPQGKYAVKNGFSWFPEDYSKMNAVEQKEITFQIRDELARFIDEITKKYPPKVKPIVTGFSYGGDLSYLLGVYYPQKLSAAIPLAGRFLDEWMPQKNLCEKNCPPILALQGDADKIVDVEKSRLAAAKLKRLNYPVELSEYKEVSHDLSPHMKTDYTKKMRQILNRIR